MLRASDLYPYASSTSPITTAMWFMKFTIRQKKTGQGHVVALSPYAGFSGGLAHRLFQRPEDFLWTSIGNGKLENI
ncbi:MAG: hypothetical protein R3B95_08190 [Nitrospirales bacterium]|nr:hypothetical protein [Nitrospirales bacterium]